MERLSETLTRMPDPNPFGGAPAQEGTDASFVLICAFIIFTMQSGFGLLESGMVSRRSEANVMVKNMLDVALGGISYWFVGYGFSFGRNSKASKTMSGESFFITDVDIMGPDASVYAHYFFQLSFATTATTIVSGAVAERIHLLSYMIFVIINTALIYTFPCHWIWNEDGWLYGKAHDFAGSAVVHMAGGAAAFSATLLLGARRGRWTREVGYFANASPTNVVLGTFFLWWGWIGFNCGSEYAISGNHWRYVGRVAVITMNGAMAGGAAVVMHNLILFHWRRYLIDIGEFTAGILGGLVSITAPANVIRPWEALVIGFIGGLVAIGVIKLLDKLKIDDPVGCVGVHWGAGVWAMIATGFFAEKGEPSSRWNGVFRHGSGELLGWNLLAALVVTVWSGVLAAIVFAVLKATLGIRLTEDEEMRGSDEVEHNVIEHYIPGRHEQKHPLGKHIERPIIPLNETNIEQNHANGAIDIVIENGTTGTEDVV